MRLSLFAITFLAGSLTFQSAWAQDNLGEASVTAQVKTGTLAISELLPAETQGCVRVVDLPRFIERWNKTQLGILGGDERLKPFWSEQRAEIQKRFADAGWQLNFKAEDLYEISTGQAGVAWVSQPTNAQRPYAVCLVMDIEGKRTEAESLLEKVDKELRQRGATTQDSQVAGTKVRQYTLPRLPGDTVIRATFYSLTETQLYATDDLTLLSNLIHANKSGGNDNALSNDKMYKATMDRIDKLSDEFDVEYFVRPIGLAKAIRFISGRAAAGKTDILKVLENQGFGKISAAAGRVVIAGDQYDVLHSGFINLDKPVNDSVQILDFPNTAATQVPQWVTPEASSLLSFAWNAKEAFWKVESIVDEVAGQSGTFEAVIQGIEEDPVGPQINIRTEVLPYVTNQVFVVTDTVSPVTVNSRRALVAIQLNDPNRKLRDVLERAMKNEPDAAPEDYRDVRLWVVSRSNEDVAMVELENDFGDFGPTSTADDSDETEESDSPLLNDWAICQFDEYLLFASHPEMLKQVVDRIKDSPTDAFSDKSDVKRVTDALAALRTGNEPCAWRVLRADRSFEMQYELFRTGELTQSQSIIATVLDRILRKREEGTNQRVKGDSLPPFENIREYLMPVGFSSRTTDEGWAIKNVVLNKKSSAQSAAQDAGSAAP